MATASSALRTYDHIHVAGLAVQAVAGPDLWQQPAPQHCAFTLDVPTDFAAAAATDDLAHSLNYATLCRQLAQLARTRPNWGSLHTLAAAAHADLACRYAAVLPRPAEMQLELRSADAHLRSRDVAWRLGGRGLLSPGLGGSATPHVFHVGSLELYACIGVFQFEREAKQRVSLDIDVQWPVSTDSNVSPPLPVRRVLDDVVRYVEASDFYTVEALVESVAKVVQQCLPVLPVAVEVRVAKLSAITDTQGVGVSCLRTGEQLEQLPPVALTPEHSLTTSKSTQESTVPSAGDAGATAYLAFGSNVGDRLSYIRKALDLLNDTANITVTAVSSLFESEPMYFKDQRPFLNGCIRVTTTLTPPELLTLCKRIEYTDLQRTKDFDNGPRCIDLDIILYTDAQGTPAVCNTPDLTVPHPRMLERTFVLEPLCELLPPTAPHPLTAEPLAAHLQQLYDRGDPADTLWRLLPVPAVAPGKDTKTNTNAEPRFLRFRTSHGPGEQPLGRASGPAHIMAVMNATPDSFSDGDPSGHTDTAQLLARVERECAGVLHLYDTVIVDVGGCSTRPGSPQPTAEEELARVLPVLRAIRASTALDQERVVLSVDTYRASVARAALENGCDIINDVSGGQFDEGIWAAVAEHPYAAYVLSHTRGTIASMNQCADYALDEEYRPTDPVSGTEYTDHVGAERCDPADKARTLVRTVACEMAQRYSALLHSDVRRWQVVLDPGLGFAKDLRSNVQMLRDLGVFRNYSCTLASDDDFVSFRNLPVLAGPSRKKFIGTITGEEDPARRDFATGAVVTAAIGYGADIVRVHNAVECAKAAAIADAMYK
ncbi:trifunctional dihydropteroate synthetase/dihydrohydroxymethylpterin pyrophosphokinase/dihydroneopterin aldolase [Maudiozyma humilis]|uniref:2-amino-4-hydroxy-6-hydroxymethyldihydropteridine diphosphokinase n=1 Tax=Maudiozyma humilis TaxID=51915 RepID=A0AAV5S534_MAUHU|nr:trifunctional dihydropteroate synthetase/dihydrohydroxymethylpterin pyrophosphokinase/dihydroneopterin aldolase [Kazachstania humilis]